MTKPKSDRHFCNACAFFGKRRLFYEVDGGRLECPECGSKDVSAVGERPEPVQSPPDTKPSTPKSKSGPRPAVKLPKGEPPDDT